MSKRSTLPCCCHLNSSYCFFHIRAHRFVNACEAICSLPTAPKITPNVANKQAEIASRSTSKSIAFLSPSFAWKMVLNSIKFSPSGGPKWGLERIRIDKDSQVQPPGGLFRSFWLSQCVLGTIRGAFWVLLGCLEAS